MSAPGFPWFPGVISNAQSVEWTLRKIYGPSLIGLWIGEDIVFDGSGNILSWPGRVGGALQNTGASDYVFSELNSRKAITGQLAGLCLKANLGVVVKSLFSVAMSPTLPFATIQILADNSGASNNNELTGLTGTSVIYANGSTHYIDGVLSVNMTPGVHVFESDQSGSSDTFLRLGYATEVYSWQAPVGCYIALSSVPTQLQRLQTQYVLDLYYRPEQAPAARLTLDLYKLFGTDLIGLWIGEDLVVSGSNVTSWPGRAGGTMSPVGTQRYSLGTLGLRKAITSAASLDCYMVSPTLSAVVKSMIAAITSPTLPFLAWQGAGNTSTSNIGDVNNLLGQSGTSDFYAEGVHYVDNVFTSTLTSGNHIVQGDNTSGVGQVAVLGGFAGASYSWRAPQGCLVALSSVPSSENRGVATGLLRAYYGS
jgi:hypothetical protein